GTPRMIVLRLGALVLPVLAGGLGLALYNYVRFDSFTEFGQRYQLAAANLHAMGGSRLFSAANIWPGLYSYLLRPVYVFGHFPFVLARGGDGTFPALIHLPAHYESHEQIAGILLVAPFAWLAMVPVLQLIRGRDRELRIPVMML